MRHPRTPRPLRIFRMAVSSLLIPLIALGVLAGADDPAPLEVDPTAATHVSVRAVADTYVDAANRRATHGGDKRLAANPSPQQRAYLRFDIPAVTAPIAHAWLRVRVVDAPTSGFAVHHVDSVNWDERKMSWTTAPKFGDVVGVSGAVAAGEWIMVDVGAWVRPGRSVSFVLIAATALATISSRETVDTPTVELELSEAAVPTTSTTATTATTAPPSTTSTTVPTWAPTTTAPPATTTTTAPPPPTTSGATYYLDAAGGSDSFAGTSPTTAWRSLARATSATLAPGDQLLLRRGQTWSGSLAMGESGTAAAPITIGAYGVGAAPIVTGASTCIALGGSHLVLTGVQADGCTWSGVDISGSANVVTGNVFAHNAAGVVVRPSGLDNRILSNQIVDNQRMSVLTQGGDDDSGAFGVLLQGDRTEVAGNTISGHDAFSYDYGRDGSAIEVYGARDSYIHHNRAVDNQTFTELGNSRSAGNTYAYNVVTSAVADSTFVITRGAGSVWGPIVGTRFFNNTAILTGANTQGFICHAGCSPSILVMRNNIVQATWKAGYADAPFDGDYNLYWGGTRQFPLGAHDIVADPVFAGGGDLHLGAGSPAIDTGVPIGYASDFEGGPLIGAPDRGAYERR